MDEKNMVLVVDDETNNLQLLQQILGKPYNLKFAINGKNALEAAQKHKPDLILLDIMMPEMDGREVCRQLKKNPVTKDIAVIFVTAMDKEEDEIDGFEFGAVDYITKPVKPAIVLARVKTHIALKTAQDKIIMQNQKLKDQARKLFNFGTQKNIQVEKMASEVAKALQAITKERGDSIKTIADILHKASQQGDHRELIASIKQKIEEGIHKMDHFPSKKVALLSLQPGMITAEEIEDKNGYCLLSIGSMITEGLIERIINLSSVKSISVIC